MYRKTYIEINKDNLTYNVKTLLHDYPDYYYYIGVVKGNAYGHGIESIQTLIDAGINYLAVSTLEEALIIRTANVTIPILLLQPIHIEDIETAIKNNIAITLSDYEYFKKLVVLTFHGELKVHLKINSGFNRLGVSDKQQVKEITQALKQKNCFMLEGIYTHFATSGRYDTKWSGQLVAFRESTSLIDLTQIPIVHLDRSLTLFSHNKIDFCTGVRIGIAMYGYNSQLVRTQTGLKALLRNSIRRPTSQPSLSPVLKPALGLYSEIIEIKKIKKGECVGYGAMWQARKDCVVGVAPIGYSDGFFRKNKNGQVMINGTRYQIITVDMNMITMLVDESVSVYDKVELIGQTVTAKEVAVRNETIVYEILCAFKESMARVLR